MTVRMAFLVLAAFGILLAGCSDSGGDSSPSPMTKQPTGAYTGQLIRKPFVNKAGRTTGPRELYLRLGMGDYFIKLSESEVTTAELEPFVNEVITVEGEIRSGEWDIGPGDPPEMQSRIGEYFVIRKLR